MQSACMTSDSMGFTRGSYGAECKKRMKYLWTNTELSIMKIKKHQPNEHICHLMATTPNSSTHSFILSHFKFEGVRRLYMIGYDSQECSYIRSIYVKHNFEWIIASQKLDIFFFSSPFDTTKEYQFHKEECKKRTQKCLQFFFQVIFVDICFVNGKIFHSLCTTNIRLVLMKFFPVLP